MSQGLGNIGPYELESELGRGAMARVWRAYDPNLAREVAIKVPLFDANLSETVLEEMGRRFVAEGRAAARLSHPGIVAVYAANVWDGQPAIVMELVDGTTLSDLMSLGPLPPTAALNILDQLLDAVGYAHDHHVIHRDIKPDNIFVTKEGVVKLADFGIARIDNGATHATMAGMVLGTPGYMSPEQARGTNIDNRSDLFSIGVIAHEMLSGSNPFGAGSGTDTTTLIYRIVHEPAPELPASVAQALPADMRPAIMAALSKDPAGRPATAEDFKLMLHGQLAPSALQSGFQTINSEPPTNVFQNAQTTPLREVHVAPTPQPTPVNQYVAPTPYVDSYVNQTQSVPVEPAPPKKPTWLPYALVGGVCAIGLVVALMSALGSGSGAGGGSGSYSTYLSVYDGRVAIFTSNSAEPYQITDVSVSDLSPEDAAQLGGRITVSSIEEAQSLIAQYQQTGGQTQGGTTSAEAEQQAIEEARIKAQQEAEAKAAEEAARQAEEAARQAESTVSITITGADGSTRTETIRRDPTTQRVIPDSNGRLLSQSEVDALTDAERCIAWNEIIAASNGYAFKNSTLASYFADCSWYSRNPNASSSGDLSGNAAKNVSMLQNATSEWWKHLAAN